MLQFDWKRPGCVEKIHLILYLHVYPMFTPWNPRISWGGQCASSIYRKSTLKIEYRLSSTPYPPNRFLYPNGNQFWKKKITGKVYVCMNIDAQTGSLQVNQHSWVVQSVLRCWNAHRTSGEEGTGSGGERGQVENSWYHQQLFIQFI